MKRQETFDDLEPVIEQDNVSEVVGLRGVKPRSRSALEVYDELQASHLEEEDPLY